MVAAHLNDLKAAKQNGLQTIYVERPGEEAWDKEQVERARQEGWVDLWISQGHGNMGFVTVAEKLGIERKGSENSGRLSASAPVGGA
jgi:2-haloacid dehalogenase